MGPTEVFIPSFVASHSYTFELPASGLIGSENKIMTAKMTYASKLIAHNFFFSTSVAK
ncbi:hypothetical protein BH10BAC2_BH10BAC2_38070 [soil metagenome]